MLNLLINILAIIGFIILISYIISYIITYFQNRAAMFANQKINPPPSYMQNSGIKCPDYFVNTQNFPNKYECSNRDFNIAVDNTACYTDPNNKTVEFPSIPDGKTWEYGDPNGLSTMSDQERWDFVNDTSSGKSRCQWINDCGAKQGLKGVWQGVQEVCNSPDPSQTTVA
jgi:hypothetical protein